jgi:aryl-alcohol dehydrogenase-like predicted oxidoreductase
MPAFPRRVRLGKSGLQVSPIGLGSSYGISEKACRIAFDAGINYFFWGSVRTVGMGLAIREIARADRQDLVVVLECYVRHPRKVATSIERGLRKAQLDYADIVLLGWHDALPAPAVLDAAEAVRERGLSRHLAISSHNRPLFVDLLEDERLDVFHVRYNAAHRGAEVDIFPHLQDDGAPGIVSFTNTRWGDLLAAKNMPAGMQPPSAADCYRFSLTNPHVQVAIAGPADESQMRAALDALESGPLDQEELARMRTIGDHVHGVRSLQAFLS